MEKKVYEGYKRTSTSAKTTAATKSSVSKKTATPQNDPNKKVSARLAGKTSNKPRLAMFIDVDNVGISRENLLEILFYANGKYQIDICKLYGFSDETLPGIRDIATEYNVVTVGKMKFKQTGSNCLDSRLLIDAYECALNNRNKIDMIFVWCYPCDLAELFEKIIKVGINTATIDNNLFDCKNNFISQKFKLYSPYHFTLEQSTYGKVKNEPSEIEPNENIENNNLIRNQTNTLAVTDNNDTTETSMDNNSTSQPKMIEGVIPPVLPRRTIVERSTNSGMNESKTEFESETEFEAETNRDEDNSKPTSLVEEIARKLKINVLSDEELEAEMNQEENETKVNVNNVNAEMIRNVLNQVGYDDLGNKKPRKYEDTIGDL